MGLETRYHGHRDVFNPGLKKEPTVPNGVGFATPLLGKEKPLAPDSSPGAFVLQPRSHGHRGRAVQATVFDLLGTADTAANLIFVLNQSITRNLIEMENFTTSRQLTISNTVT